MCTVLNVGVKINSPLDHASLLPPDKKPNIQHLMLTIHCWMGGIHLSCETLNSSWWWSGITDCCSPSSLTPVTVCYVHQAFPTFYLLSALPTIQNGECWIISKTKFPSWIGERKYVALVFQNVVDSWCAWAKTERNKGRKITPSWFPRKHMYYKGEACIRSIP